MQKKGYYRIASMGMIILCFILIGVAIGIGNFIFFSNQVDIRDQESMILADKIARGMNENGLVNLDSFNIYETSGLNPKIINNGDYYLKVEIFSNEELIKTIEEGNRNFEVECGLSSKKFPKCTKKDFFINDYRVIVSTGSNQVGRRA